MIQYTNIYQEYKGRELFGGISFSIDKGDKTVLTGPSGSGKTTLLNYLTGFDMPDSGEIIFEGRKIAPENINVIRKKLFWLPQNINDIGEGKIRDTILLPFSFKENRQLAPDENRITGELANNGLEKDILDSDFSEISGGEKQRIGLVMAKLLRREIILLDEPTSALDEGSIKKVVDLFLKNNNLTIISVSHNNTWIANCTKNIRIGNESN